MITKAQTLEVLTGIRPRRKAQAIVEMALMGTLLAVLLAGTVDLGRAYYTSVVVANMAGEGAAYAAIHPDFDANYPAAGSCSRYSIAADSVDTIQSRARRVAINRGLVIRNPSQSDITILNGAGRASTCSTRCSGSTVTVKVTYRITDLFLPGMLGINHITITKSSSQRLMKTAWIAENACTP
jgi:Flp pilus assembly protein TadG